MNRAIVLIYLALFVGNICLAQPSSNQPANDWAENATGVRLSIVLSNNIMSVGSTTIEATIQNLSTNVVGLVEFTGVTDFDVFLINSSGKSFKLTPPKPLSGSRVPIMLEPGASRNWAVPITIGNEFKPGQYVLTASRRFSANGSWFDLKSNLLNVQLVR